jgi:hypothetical protein
MPSRWPGQTRARSPRSDVETRVGRVSEARLGGGFSLVPPLPHPATNAMAANEGHRGNLSTRMIVQRPRAELLSDTCLFSSAAGRLSENMTCRSCPQGFVGKVCVPV